LLVVRGLLKNYQALRPLRIQSLQLQAGEIVTILGLDAPAAEMLVGLLTGAMVPDEGEVRLFGRSTADIGDADAWLAFLDAVGIMTDRAVLIEQFSVLQNVALPFTLEVDPLGEAAKRQADALARETGVPADALTVPVGRAGAETQVRVRLARALALSPRLLIAEHPSATLPRDAVRRVAADLARAVRARGTALLVLTADAELATAIGGATVKHDAASGALQPVSRGWRSWF
jgi:predicted ABC-type transport system involved in lysophospholipase L1 biosynthesis ATPase subunit